MPGVAVCDINLSTPYQTGVPKLPNKNSREGVRFGMGHMMNNECDLKADDVPLGLKKTYANVKIEVGEDFNVFSEPSKPQTPAGPVS